MLLVGPAAASFAASVSILVASTSPLVDDPSPPPLATSAPALQVIVGYGKLASNTCFGKTSPPGSSCQLPLSYLERELGLLDNAEGGGGGGGASSLTYEEFSQRLNSLPFRWPLKPYGTNEKSKSKTAALNKGAETAYYMDELESRGLYDRRDPTGPLPTSLRPKLNAVLDREVGVGDDASRIIFGALAGDIAAERLTRDALEGTFRGRDDGDDVGVLDYYGFLDLVGNGNIDWPRYAADRRNDVAAAR